MGITTYLFHKSDSLAKQRFNMFFLDMGENIHFHYRDLRIELSVGEFIELAEQFNRNAPGVLAEIDGGYQDGVLANTNEAGTLKTFWDKEQRLQNPVRYHERQLAIEETKDGYHLHIRNYKILLDEPSFRALVEAMAPLQPLLAEESLKREPFALLQHNELQPQLIRRLETATGDELIIGISKTFRNKAGQVLKAIGYSELAGEQQSGGTFIRGTSTVQLVLPGTVPSELPVVGTRSHLPLPDFCAAHGSTLDAQQLNLLKLRVLGLFKLAGLDKMPLFKLADISINTATLLPSVDLYTDAAGVDPDEEIKAFNALLMKHQLFFVKPEKEYFTRARQDEVQDRFFLYVINRIASCEGVKKIFTLGSAGHHRIGRYQVPFIHFDWVKLNSDFDIYVEMDPEYDGPLPEYWEKKFYWQKTGSDYYHFGDVGSGMSSDFAREYPGVRFYEHLVEGYVFDPRSGDQGKRDEWFGRINAKCIFSRDLLAEWVNGRYDIGATETERFSAASFNTVYRVKAAEKDYVLKVYNSKYLNKKAQKKIPYEIGLLDAMRESGLPVNLPVRNRDGKYLTEKDKDSAVLFTMLPGRHVVEPAHGQVTSAGRLLARYHLAAKSHHLKAAGRYSIKDSLFYWLDAWREYHFQGVAGTDITLPVETFRKHLSAFASFPTHCHGDLSVINYLFTGEDCALIDFQNVGFGPASIDLANGMIEFSARNRAFLYENMELFRQGYEEVRPLGAGETEMLPELLTVQAMVRQAKLIRLHFGGFGYDLKEDRLIGLRMGIEYLMQEKS